MKIQFSLVHPDMVSKTEGTSILAGIVQTREEIPDFTVTPFVFNHEVAVEGPDKVAILKHCVSDNLLNREKYWPENILEDSFHGLLTKHVWKGVNSVHPAGEVAFVKTNFPDTPEGENTYAIFGIIKGDREALKAFSNRVFSSNVDTDQAIGPWNMTQTVDTGIEAKHTIGSHLLSIIGQQLWGFGDKKYGMRSDISIPTQEGFVANSRNIIEHGVHLPNMRQSSPEPRYVDYLRRMDVKGLIPGPQWEDAEGDKIRGEASAEILRAQQVEEEAKISERLSRRHAAESDGPSL